MTGKPGKDLYDLRLARFNSHSKGDNTKGPIA